MRVTREQSGLGGGGGADTVTAVVEDEALRAGDPVPPEAPLHLDCELPHDLAVGQRRRRAEHERDRPRQVSAAVCVRTANVAEDEVRLAQVLLHPVGVDDRREAHPAETSSRSAATAGLAATRSSQLARAGNGSSSTSSRSVARSSQGT